MIFPREWLDKNNLVKSRQIDPYDGKPLVSSGNGILHTSMFVLLSVVTEELKTWYWERILPCFKKPGLLMRTPDNKFGNETHDDIMALLAACIRLGNTEIPRKMFWYGVRHFFFYYNDFYFSFENLWRSFFWKYPHVLALMFAASYPKLKVIVYLILWLTEKLQKAGTVVEIGASAIQLQFIFMIAYIHLYGRNSTYVNWRNSIDLKSAFLNYYDADQPFLGMI